jgi:lipoic acid synthetase
VEAGFPKPLDPTEPQRVAEAIKRLGLRYVVLTSVTRDDLPDGGSQFFRQLVDTVKSINPAVKIEALVPDFGKSKTNWELFVTPNVDVFAHNVEVTRNMFPKLRPKGDLDISLDMLRFFKEKGYITKTGFMVGVGETMDDIRSLLTEIAASNVDMVTVGQYLQPSKKHWPVQKYYSPEEFNQIAQIGKDVGIPVVVAGPLVRSSYLADQAFIQLSAQSQ